MLLPKTVTFVSNKKPHSLTKTITFVSDKKPHVRTPSSWWTSYLWLWEDDNVTVNAGKPPMVLVLQIWPITPPHNLHCYHIFLAHMMTELRYLKFCRQSTILTAKTPPHRYPKISNQVSLHGNYQAKAFTKLSRLVAIHTSTVQIWKGTILLLIRSYENDCCSLRPTWLRFLVWRFCLVSCPKPYTPQLVQKQRW